MRYKAVMEIMFIVVGPPPKPNQNTCDLNRESYSDISSHLLSSDESNP